MVNKSIKFILKNVKTEYENYAKLNMEGEVMKRKYKIPHFQSW